MDPSNLYMFDTNTWITRWVSFDVISYDVKINGPAETTRSLRLCINQIPECTIDFDG